MQGMHAISSYRYRSSMPPNRQPCLLFLGPLGFIVGPLMAWRGLRKTKRIYAEEASAARQRDQGLRLPSGGS